MADGKSESSSSFESMEWPVPIEELLIEEVIVLETDKSYAWFGRET